jgi:hypothetical protein
LCSTATSSSSSNGWRENRSPCPAKAPIAVVAFAGVLASLMPEFPFAAGGFLLFGCRGVLFANVARA